MSPASAKPAPDWPRSGRIRPTLESRIERRVKRLLLPRGRRRPASRGEAHLSNLDLVYREAASAQPVWSVQSLRRAYRDASDPAAAIETSLAALALAVGAAHRPRILGLVSFLELCYVETTLDAAVAALGERLGGAIRPHSKLAALECQHGWRVFAAGLRAFSSSLPALAPPRRRGRIRGADLPPRRVVVRVEGGLGNQLFQYAAGLAYARRSGIPLRLDLINYEGPDPDREFLLGRLRVPVRRANSFEVLWARRRPIWEDRAFVPDFLLRDSGSAWLSGFWEDPAYFAGAAEVVKRQFAPRDPKVAAAASALVEQARAGSEPVVGVHLRRGDRGPGGNSYSPFSTMPTEYYRQAAARFPSGTSFLVFSDTPGDIAWCRENLGIGNQGRVTFGEGLDPVLDLFALARSDHVILSSGTFSWWAGFLGHRDGRRVILPNPLQALSAERVMVPPPSPPLDGWEEITLPRQ